MMRTPGPVVLAGTLLILALSLVGLAWFFPGTLSEITNVHIGEVKGQPSKSLKADDLAASLAAWNSPVLWKEPQNHQRLFNPEDWLFFPASYPGGNFLQKMGPDARSPGGVLLSWYQKYGMDITQPDIDHQDPDNDGFSNLTEYKNEKVGERLNAADLDGSNSTNPLDAQSHPDYLARLRLQSYEHIPFHILFKGYNQLNGEYVFQIYLADVPSDKQPPFKKSGDPLGVGGYIVGEFHQVTTQEMDKNLHVMVTVDRSTLELDRPDIDLKIILPFRKEIDSPESTADFVMLMPSERDKVIKVQRGKILTIPYIPATQAQYLLIDVDDNGAKLRDTKTKQEYHILKLDPKEWLEIPATSH